MRILDRSATNAVKNGLEIKIEAARKTKVFVLVSILVLIGLAGCSNRQLSPELEYSPQTATALEHRIAELDW